MDLIPIEQIAEQLHNRYRTSGYSEQLFKQDMQIIRRLGVHPALATYEDLERVITLEGAEGIAAFIADWLTRHPQRPLVTRLAPAATIAVLLLAVCPFFTFRPFSTAIFINTPTPF